MFAKNAYTYLTRNSYLFFVLKIFKYKLQNLLVLVHTSSYDEIYSSLEL